MSYTRRQRPQGSNHGDADPAPGVWFSDFGDNALIFKLLFWITLTKKVGRQQIESDIRFRIDALFREEGLVIAFPQRDVHLDTSQPLELKILNSGDSSMKG